MAMRRKLVKQGPSTMTVSLPATWVRANHLNPGDEVLLGLEHNNIVISVEGRGEQESNIHIDISGFSEDFIRVLLSALHKKGYEEVRLVGGAHQANFIQNRISKNLLGYEIVQQNEEGIVIRFVTKVDADELPLLVRRAFLVTLSLAEGAAAQHENGQRKELLVLEETNNRLTNYCQRILVKNMYHHKDGVFTYVIIWLLEKLADEYKLVIKSEAKYDSSDADTCLRMLRQFYDLYYKYSFERHDAFLRDLYKSIAALKKKKSNLQPVLNTLEQTGGSIIALNTH